ncbi:MAG: hypothetical protein EAZ57_00080 [Cytophagales bacterium]|nr:MAG: hypothetical protein EAZ67_04605 [Cytophagales bacterium]TAF62534.1 MAG: hypothetical protein EAZ57_00080 [Cytophagales bacterium]
MVQIFAVLAFLLVLKADQDDTIKLCTERMPNIEDRMELPPNVLSAVAFDADYGYYWDAGSTIRVKFMAGGTPYVRGKVRTYAREWSKYANIKFSFVESGSAEIRISFKRNSGSWSYIGKDALNRDQSEPTMNFGWLYDNTDEDEFRRVILHEFGHALGLLHEHQHSSGGVPWDTEAVYRYYDKQGWSRDYTYDNVIKRYNTSHTQFTKYDRQSIMHYAIPNELTKGDFEVGWNTRLSPQDIQFIKKAYPGAEVEPERARSFLLSVKNSLGEKQLKETVYITINGITKTCSLHEDSNSSGRVLFDLPEGTHNYEIRTMTTFYNIKRVWNGSQYINQKTYNVKRGFGKGQVKVQKSDCMSIYMGDAIDRVWFEVYLDPCEANNNRSNDD